MFAFISRVSLRATAALILAAVFMAPGARTSVSAQDAPAVDPALTGTPTSKPPRYDEALKLYQEQKYDGSLDVIRSVFSLTYKPYQMRMLAAANYSKQGKNANAVDHMVRCIKEHPTLPEPRAFLAGLYRGMGKYGAALRTVAGGLRVSSENTALRMEAARINYKLKRYGATRRHIQVVLKTDPNNFEAIVLDGLIFLRTGRYENAEFRFRNALTLKPTNSGALADLYNNLGYAMESRGDAARRKRENSKAAHFHKKADEMYRFALQTRAGHGKAEGNRRRVLAKLASTNSFKTSGRSPSAGTIAAAGSR